VKETMINHAKPLVLIAIKDIGNATELEITTILLDRLWDSIMQQETIVLLLK
jgi:hypothetical protein